MKLWAPEGGDGGGGGNNATATAKETAAPAGTETKATETKAGESMLETKQPEGTKAAATETKDAKVETKAPALVDEKWEPGAAPEGVTRDTEAFKSAKQLFGELKLTTEQAQKLVEYADAQTVEAAKFLKQRSADWLASIKSDKELGGAKFEATKSEFQAGLKALAGDQAKALADDIKAEGLENWPPLVRLLSAAGRRVADDKVKDTVVDPAAAAQNEHERRNAKTYGNTTRKES